MGSTARTQRGETTGRPLTSGDAGSDPGSAVRRAPAAVPELPGALRREPRCGSSWQTNRQSIGVIIGAYESARTGRPVQL